MKIIYPSSNLEGLLRINNPTSGVVDPQTSILWFLPGLEFAVHDNIDIALQADDLVLLVKDDMTGHALVIDIGRVFGQSFLSSANGNALLRIGGLTKRCEDDKLLETVRITSAYKAYCSIIFSKKNEREATDEAR